MAETCPCRRSRMLPVIGLVEAPDQAQDRGLAAARRPQERKKLAVLDVEGHVAHGLQGAELFDDVLKVDFHSACLSWLLLAGRLGLNAFLIDPCG